LFQILTGNSGKSAKQEALELVQSLTAANVEQVKQNLLRVLEGM